MCFKNISAVRGTTSAALVLLGAFFVAPRAVGGPEPAFLLGAAVANADVIAVGQFQSVVRPPGPWPPPGSKMPSKALFRVDAIVKGAASSEFLTVAIDYSVGSQILGQETIGFFTATGGQLRPYLSSSAAFLPGRVGQFLSSGSAGPRENVISILAAVVSDRGEARERRLAAMRALTNDPGVLTPENRAGLEPQMSDPAIGPEIAMALARNGDHEAIQAVSTSIQSGDLPAATQREALSALAAGGAGAAPRDLVPLLASDDPETRLEAVRALGRGGVANTPLLGRALDDPDVRVRQTAVFGLGRVTHQPAWGGPPYAPGRGGADPFVQHEATYIAYWKQWLAQHPQP